VVDQLVLEEFVRQKFSKLGLWRCTEGPEEEEKLQDHGLQRHGGTTGAWLEGPDEEELQDLQAAMELRSHSCWIRSGLGAEQINNRRDSGRERKFRASSEQHQQSAHALCPVRAEGMFAYATGLFFIHRFLFLFSFMRILMWFGHDYPSSTKRKTGQSSTSNTTRVI
jgi:hypothetical protein